MRCRFKGMIYPNMGLTYEAGAKITARKSIFMVLYLRERRGDGRLKAFFRNKHFATEGRR